MSDEVRLIVSRDEAVVLFEWIRRVNAQGETVFEDQAEQRVLWNLEALLESTLVEPFQSNYAEMLLAARARVRDAID